MQETVLVHNRIYSLLETVGRTNPAIDWNTTPSPDYSKLKLRDNVGGKREPFVRGSQAVAVALRQSEPVRRANKEHRPCCGDEGVKPAPGDVTGGMESQIMQKPGKSCVYA